MRHDARQWVSWHRALAGWDDNRYGVTIIEEVGVTGLLLHGAPVTLYNRVIVTGDVERCALTEVTNFYRERLTPSRIEIADGGAVHEHAGALGFAVSQVHSALIGPPKPAKRAARRSVVVRRVRPVELDFFARLYEHAYFGPGQPAGLSEMRVASVKARFRDPSWRFYMTVVDGVPAGGGAMFIDGDVATLCGGATIYTLRGRGGQTGLLRARLSDAADLGCTSVLARCRRGSISQRNMERAGLGVRLVKLIYEQSIWTPAREGSGDVHIPATGVPPRLSTLVDTGRTRRA